MNWASLRWALRAMVGNWLCDRGRHRWETVKGHERWEYCGRPACRRDGATLRFTSRGWRA
ncbi:hypothetical protein SEA_VULPECULA_58 [Arthrobacter phage Vulpecula]|nr:hypothetical protein SEA_VULPECULA_58 [Arthrobacter phage Vulpecula]